MRSFGTTCHLGLAALLALMPSAGAARADTLDVPAEYPTIQAAIMAAQPGDTVLVAPGTYVETIDFLGKGITVESSGGAQVTTIDGGGAGSVVRFASGEPAGTTLKGFTVTGGAGSPTTATSTTIVGGGIKVWKSKAAVVACAIVGNSAPHYGGGIFVSSNFQSGSTSLSLSGCMIASNSVTGAGLVLGGGIYVDGSNVGLSNCEISSNTCSGSGGGFAVQVWSGTVGSLTATDCVIAANAAGAGGGGSAFLAGSGSSVNLVRCQISGNSAGFGGGISGTTFGDSFWGLPIVELTDCRVFSNIATGSGGGLALSGDIFGIASVSDCLVVDNVALSGEGGGLRLTKWVQVSGCTIAGNQAPVAGGLACKDANGSIDGSIVWGNLGGQIDGAGPTFSWCDVEGGLAGTGNIDVDPHFVDPANGDYHVAPTSACVDAGNPAMSPSASDHDVDGDLRVLFGRIDIGADEATTPAGPWTFLGHALSGDKGAPSLEGAGELTPGSETTLSLSGAAASSASWLVAGADQLLQPFKGGVIVPTPDMLVGPAITSGAGTLALSGRWPNGIPSGFVVSLQMWIADATGPWDFTASNGVAAESQ